MPERRRCSRNTGAEIPVVGGLIRAAVVCLGLGALSHQLYRSARATAA